MNPVRLRLQCTVVFFCQIFFILTIAGDGSTDIFKQYRDLLDNDKWENQCVKATVIFCFGVAVKYARSFLSESFILVFLDGL